MQSSCPLCRKTPPEHDASSPMLHCRYGIIGMILIILLPPNTANGVKTKKFYFGLIWPQDFLPWLLWIIQMVPGKLQTAWTWADLSRGTFRAMQDFKPWRLSVLLIVALETMVPALFTALTSSSRVVLGWFFTILSIIDTHKERSSVGPQSEGHWQSSLASLPFSDNCSNSCSFFHQAAWQLPRSPFQLCEGLQFCLLCLLTALWFCPCCYLDFGWLWGAQVSLWQLTTSNRCY